MELTYRDEMGYVTIQVNKYGITFNAGVAYFTGEDFNDYEVPITSIVSIF